MNAWVSSRARIKTIMPALKAFGVKWRIGSDDFVFPYTLSVIFRALWFASIGYMLVNYDQEYRCNDERLLKIYLLILLGVHITLSIIEVIMILFSARGTIADPKPRMALTWMLYVKTLLFFAELIWDCVGVIWAFDPSIDCPMSHKILIFVRLVLLWNLFSNLVVALYMGVRIGVCGLCFRRTPGKLRYESGAPKVTYKGRRLSRVSSTSLGHHTRQRTWQWRLQCLFCCLRLRNQQRNVFSEISAVLSDVSRKFRGYVPSDVLAGMALVSMEQSAKKRHGSEKEIIRTSSRNDVNFDDVGIQTHFNKTLRYLDYSTAAYGWHYFVSSRGIIGILILMFSCCSSKKDKVEDEVKGEDEVDEVKVEDRVKADIENNEDEAAVIRGDNIFGWSKMIIKRHTGCRDKDILHATFNSEVYCPAFYVVADHSEETIVVTVRGTMSLGDTLTDFSAQPGLLMVRKSIKYYAHKGMINSAQALKLKLEGEGILHRAFRRYPSYRLVITGHSLGAGCASLLAMLLYSTYRKLHCFAYAPIGGIISLSAVSYTRKFITTVVVGNDLVPRLSLQNVEALGERVLNKMQTSQLPKYRIFLNSFFYWMGLCTPGRQHIEDDISGKESEEVLLQRVVDEELKAVDPVTGKAILEPLKRHDLYLPGKIVHLQWEEKKCFLFELCNRRPITAQWTAQSEFSELFLDSDIVNNHMPLSILKAMRALKVQEGI